MGDRESYRQNPTSRFVHRKLRAHIIERDKSTCQMCGDELDTKTHEKSDFGRARILYHLDHIVPFAKGGPTTADNLRLVCPTCNRSRNRKHGRYG